MEQQKIWDDLVALANDCIPYGESIISRRDFIGMAQEHFDLYSSLPTNYRKPTHEEDREHRQLIYELCHSEGALGIAENAMDEALRLVHYLSGHLSAANDYGRKQCTDFLEKYKDYKKP